MKNLRTANFAVCLLLLLLVQAVSSQTSDTVIVGGERAGPFRLGLKFSEVEQRLGPPTTVVPSSEDPNTSTRIYRPQKLAFLVGPENTVIGVTVAQPGWKTDRGFGIGAPVLAFEEAFGKGLKRGAEGLAYPQHGLAISHENGKVHTIYVVKKDTVEKGRGDHLLIGGNRAGEIRLGSNATDIVNLLGRPPQTQGANSEIWVYPELGIRLAFLNQRLHLIGISSGDWVTPSGLKIGRPFSDMKRELGGDYRVQESSVFYDRWGIGARLQGEQILEILIFNPKSSGAQG